MPIHIGRKKAGNIDTLLQYFKINLTAMSVARNGQVKALRGRHRKNVGIMGKEDVRRARNDQIFCPDQILRASSLVIDSDQI